MSHDPPLPSPPASPPELHRPIIRRLRGKIVYRHDVHGETGREWFDICVHTDGRRVLTAQCELDDAALMRDVTLCVGADWAPQDAYVRLARAGAFQGAAWFRFAPDRIESERWLADEGRSSDVIDGPRPQVFAAHPVQGDAWQTASWNPSGPARQTIRGANPCPKPDGTSGPKLHLTVKDIERVGPERVTTPAGSFAAEHFRIHPEHFDAPLDLWVHGPDRVLTRLTWAHLASTYELTELTTT